MFCYVLPPEYTITESACLVLALQPHDPVADDNASYYRVCLALALQPPLPLLGKEGMHWKLHAMYYGIT